MVAERNRSIRTYKIPVSWELYIKRAGMGGRRLLKSDKTEDKIIIDRIFPPVCSDRMLPISSLLKSLADVFEGLQRASLGCWKPC